MTTYYIAPAPAGNDAHSGTIGQPWLTLQHAADTVPSNAEHTISVAAGTYTAGMDDYGNGAGANQFRHWRTTGGTVAVNGRIFLHGNDIKFQGFTVTGINDTPDWDGAVWVGGTRTVVDLCVIHDVVHYGIVTYSGSSYCVISNNIIYDNIQAAIAANGTNNQYLNNDISRQKTTKYGKYIDPYGGDSNAFEFAGTGHLFSGNYIHDIYASDFVTLVPHFDAFQTASGGTGGGMIFEKNRVFIGNPATNTLELIPDPASALCFNIFMIQGEAGNYVDGITIRNNIFECAEGGYNSGGPGPGYARNIEIYNNVFKGDLRANEQAPGYPTGINMSHHDHVKVYNNIIINYHYACLVSQNSAAPETVDFNYNLCYMSDGNPPFWNYRYGTGTTGDHDIANNTNPLFVTFNNNGGGVGLNDFHLQASSPCKNTGATIATVTDDYAGNPRPQGSNYEIGAYEFVEDAIPGSEFHDPRVNQPRRSIFNLRRNRPKI